MLCMPAIDLSRLSREVDRLRGAFASPGDVVRGAVDVLDFYAERARRPAAVPAPEDRGRSLDVPAPVLRAIGIGLQTQAGMQPEDCWPVVQALWDADLRETRVLACWVLSGLNDPAVARWVELRAADLEDPAVLTAVVERALLGWRRSSGRAYIEQMERWLGAPNSVLHALGLRALLAGLEMPELEDLHRAFQALARLPHPVRGEARQALGDLLAALAKRSPAETTRFLLEGIEHGLPGMERQARSLLAALPQTQRERLTAALGASSARNAST
jgi:hypothetical protein